MEYAFGDLRCWWCSQFIIFAEYSCWEGLFAKIKNWIDGVYVPNKKDKFIKGQIPQIKSIVIRNDQIEKTILVQLSGERNIQIILQDSWASQSAKDHDQ